MSDVIEVSWQRVGPWLAGFHEQHRVVRSVYEADSVRFEAADGTVAVCEPPFPPLTEVREHEGLAAEKLIAHVERERVVGVLLARLGGHGAGVFEGDRMVAWKVGSRPVHGRNAAGGWSQQRFQRRRENQAREAAHAAAGDAARVLLPRLSVLQAVVLGGDRRAIDAVREDNRLAPVFARAVDRFLTTPDPKLAVLADAPRLFRGVRARVIEAASAPSSKSTS
jgi:Actinobacteria/chloroflexi VLRF1 release factor